MAVHSAPGVVLASGGASSVVLTQTFSLTAQQIKDSMLTPHTIIPAQGAGKLIVPDKYVWNFVAGGTPFSGNDIDLVWNDVDLNLVFSGLQGSGFAGWSSSTFSAGYSEGGAYADYVNQPLQLAANLRGAALAGTVSTAGTGYAPGDTGTIDDGSPLATYVIDSVFSGGVVSFTITGGGGDYSLQGGRTHSEWTTTPGGAQPGGGSGFIASITSVDAGASAGTGTLSGVIYYVVADLT